MTDPADHDPHRAQAGTSADPYRQQEGQNPERRRNVADLVVSILLLVLLGILAFLATIMAGFLVMASDPCGSAVQCDYNLMGVGFYLAFLSPGVITVIALIVTIILLVKRRLAFWVPLAGIVLVVLAWIGGAAIVAAGVPGTTL